LTLRNTEAKTTTENSFILVAKEGLMAPKGTGRGAKVGAKVSRETVRQLEKEFRGLRDIEAVADALKNLDTRRVTATLNRITNLLNKL
jgi:hypothetical protein